MDFKLFQKSNTLSTKEVKQFIDSFFEEPYYFSCYKEDLISLKEYLLDLKEREEQYLAQIEKPYQEIVHKNDWVRHISPAFSLPGISYVLSGIGAPNIRVPQKEGPATMLSYQSDYDNYFKKKRFIERVKVFENSVDELNEIKDITDGFDFSREREGMLSASNNFIVSPVDFDQIEVRTVASPLFSVNPHEENVYFYRIARIEFNKTQYSYNRVLEKIYVKK